MTAAVAGNRAETTSQDHSTNVKIKSMLIICIVRFIWSATKLHFVAPTTARFQLINYHNKYVRGGHFKCAILCWAVKFGAVFSCDWENVSFPWINNCDFFDVHFYFAENFVGWNKKTFKVTANKRVRDIQVPISNN